MYNSISQVRKVPPDSWGNIIFSLRLGAFHKNMSEAVADTLTCGFQKPSRQLNTTVVCHRKQTVLFCFFLMLTFSQL